jgi:hypothetical protein
MHILYVNQPFFVRSEHDSDLKRVKEVESHSQAVPGVKGSAVKYDHQNYYFPIRAHRPVLLQKPATNKRTTEEPPVPTIFNTRTVTIRTTPIPFSIEVDEDKEWYISSILGQKDH